MKEHLPSDPAAPVDVTGAVTTLTTTTTPPELRSESGEPDVDRLDRLEAAITGDAKAVAAIRAARQQRRG